MWGEEDKEKEQQKERKNRTADGKKEEEAEVQEASLFTLATLVSFQKDLDLICLYEMV